MNRATLLIFVVFSGIIMYAQKTQQVSATYTYYAPETMSVEEAKRTALERAKIQAIADEFGTTVSQSTATIVTNQNGESDTKFFSFGESDVKGEWIETIEAPTYEITFENHFLVVKCYARGVIREINKDYIEISTNILRNGTSLKYESSEFREGDDMYLHIQSPVNGFMAVFWIDNNEDKAYKILPYQGDSSALMPVFKDKKIIFFSKSESDDLYSSIVDEFVMTCGSEIEHNEVYVIFYETKFSVNNIDGLSDGIKWVSIQNFHKWLAKTKKNHPDITTKHYNITIKPL